MKQKTAELLEELVEQEQQERREIQDEWYDGMATFLPAPVLQEKYRKMLRALKESYRQMLKMKDADTIDAFVALGGHPNTSGEVESGLLRKNVKEFGLTIDIDTLISEADTDGSGLIDFVEFKEMFEADATEAIATLQLPGSTPRKRFSVDHINPTTLPNYLTFSGKDTGIEIPHTYRHHYNKQISLSTSDALNQSSCLDVSIENEIAKPTKKPSKKGKRGPDIPKTTTAVLPQYKTGILVDTEKRVPQWCFTRDLLLNAVDDKPESTLKPPDHSLPRIPIQASENVLAVVQSELKIRERNKLRKNRAPKTLKKTKNMILSSLPEFQCSTIPSWSVPEGLKRMRPSTSNSQMGTVSTQSQWKDLKMQTKVHSRRLRAGRPIPDVVPYQPPLKVLLSKQRWGFV